MILPDVLRVVLALVSAGAFAYYGAETLFAVPPRGEYERYGMPNVRRFVGSMQLLGSAGVLIGLRIPALGAAAAAGLAMMMTLGLVVRYRIHDAPRLMVPAGSLAALNFTLLVLFLAE